MSAAKWIDSMRYSRDLELTVGEYAEIEEMLVNGELRHVDGSFVAALASLADIGRAEHCGATIKRERSDAYRVSFDGEEWVEDSAIGALSAIEERERRKRLAAISARRGATGTWTGEELTVKFSAPMVRCDDAVPRSPSWREPDMNRVKIDAVEILGVLVDPRDLPANVRKALAELAHDVEFEND